MRETPPSGFRGPVWVTEASGLECLHKSFCSRLIESVLRTTTNSSVARTPPLPLLLRRLRALPFRFPSATPTLSSSYQAFLLRARDGGNVILGLLIKFIGGETDPIEPRPGWMRVLAMRSYAGSVAMPSSCSVRQRYDALATTMIPAALLAPTSSPSYPLQLQAPCLASPNRIFMATTAWTASRDSGDGYQRNDAERR
ncbi:hypothetical protein BGY98DRAFT_1102259 [Russula aff. rugulosa BPL654]|nr:hypothetical protein BGY98DRAFT_1102259 [Russula aff. rugulosa BPL654]